ncbi:MAG: hypothetical protein Q7U47_04100 [Paludibacter sp.]|nr:hypothetical protein [Paludibacter sp.]
MINSEKHSKFIVQYTLFILFFVSCTNPDIHKPSDYITDVFEYVYAPGQHAQLVNSTNIQYFKGNPALHSGWLYLGGFGGYVIAGFDHNILNHEGFDFEVYSLKGAVPEPAVVYVMQDVNGDGLPNETWYELKGNQYGNSKQNYWVRYYKAKTDSANITWLDSDNKQGELISGYGAKYTSGWWSKSVTTDSITLHGTRLPDAYDNNPINGTPYWTVPIDRFKWGYAENNFGTDYDAALGSNKLDISNAVDIDGKLVNLSDIRFIKVQTGVFQQAGWLNEVSSEVRGAKELK